MSEPTLFNLQTRVLWLEAKIKDHEANIAKLSKTVVELEDKLEETNQLLYDSNETLSGDLSNIEDSIEYLKNQHNSRGA
jgi:predicted  nucleic acid-binding Zn-ribbon protein